MNEGELYLIKYKHKEPRAYFNKICMTFLLEGNFHRVIVKNTGYSHYDLNFIDRDEEWSISEEDLVILPGDILEKIVEEIYK